MRSLETSFDLMLWRAALAHAGPAPTGTELAEWAETLAAAGTDEAAAMLRDVACLHRGFAPHAHPSPALPPPHDPISGSTLHRALDEVRMLAREIAHANLPRLVPPPRPGFSGRPDNPAGVGDGIPAPAAPGDVAMLACELRAALEELPGGNGTTVVGPLHARLLEADRRLPTLDYRTFAQAPLTLLVPAIATAGLVDWALTTRDLACAPLGSPLLLHRAARLDDAGLGPYFRNVGRLVRDAADLFDLARLAAETGGGRDTGAWIALLSRGCRGALLCEIVDELGDIGASGILGVVLDRAVSRPTSSVDYDMIFRVRDAALDNADYGLAGRAQQAVARLRPDSKLEAVILGTIEASGGAYGRAEAIFRHWLARSPDDADLRARLVAVKGDRFDAFRLTCGFGSSADRREARLRRRGVPPGYPRRRGKRIEAVDVR